mmetsp:Transcript_58237/g.127849  ORF Transcript_58237/g.127849 Transcript_58237/m.127849 type:complete len:395 (+) Transcript_58237:164-1348(+)
MSHDGASSDDALGGAQVLAQAPGPLDGVHQAGACLGSAHDVEPEHAAVEAVAVVLVGQLLLGVRGEAGVDDLGDLRVALQELGDLHGGGALLLHSESHGLGGLEDHEGGEGVHDVAVDVLDPLHLVSQLLVLRDHGATSHDVVAFVVLGQTLNDHVRTVVERSADDRGGESGVHNMVRTDLLGDFGDALDVAEREDGVGRGLGEDQLRVGLDGLTDVVDVSEIAESELHAHRGEELAAGSVGAAIGAVSDDTVVASLHGGADGAGGGSHASSEGACSGAVLELGEFRLQGGGRWVVGSRVREALLQVGLDGVLDEGGRQEERSQDRTRLLLGLDGGMDQVGLESLGSLHPSARLGGEAAGRSGHADGSRSKGEHDVASKYGMAKPAKWCGAMLR